MKMQQGFTLIELMIVVAIIAILAAIAISQYQDYVIRSQVSEGATLADGVKTAMGEFTNHRGTYPTANASAGLSSAASIKGEYVSSINVNDAAVGTGVIVASYGGTKANVEIPATSNLQFSAVRNSGSVEWHCKSDTLKQKWCPSNCTCSG